MKPISFLGGSLDAIRDFPDGPRHRAGVELRAVQNGLEPNDWKPMKTVGPSVREIRIRDAMGAFRIIYLSTLPDRVLVLHAFRKKTQQTARRDIDLAARRLRVESTTMNVETFDSVFDALADTSAEAANMTARADLLLAIRERVRAWGLTQEEAAARLGLTRPRLNDLMRGKLEKFSLDALVNIAAAAGFKLHIELQEVKAA
jgi:phage-related protein/predicted XRE-type DNA-binding protein